jgi:hypothetical protein
MYVCLKSISEMVDTQSQNFFRGDQRIQIELWVRGKVSKLLKLRSGVYLSCQRTVESDPAFKSPWHVTNHRRKSKVLIGSHVTQHHLALATSVFA